MDPLAAYKAVNQVGFYGCLKSLLYSTKFAGDPTALVLHSKVITNISAETEFDINNRLSIGIKESAGTHPRITRSKFETKSGSLIAHTGDGHARVGPGSVLRVSGDFSIGDSFINGFSLVICNDEITIGDGCAIGWDCVIMDSDGHQIAYDSQEPPRRNPIEIQDNVWIGVSSIVNKGVTIHEGSVVASGSVVVSDVPANTLVGGNPAKVLRENVSWE